MSKIDKKSIIVLLILTMLFTIISPIQVKAAETIDVNPALEKSGVKAKIVRDRALLSDGSLWKIESESTAKIIDTEVKDYNYIYSRNSDGYYYYAKLKNDKKLYIESVERQNETKVKEAKTISNVKKLAEIYDGSCMAYLTYTNELYFMDPDEEQGNINFSLVAEDVEQLIGQYYIKNGKTYVANGKKILDQEIDVAYKDYCAVGNTLYEAYPYGSDYSYFYQCATDFKEFTNTENTNGWMTYKSTDGTIKQTGDYSSSQQIYRWHELDGSILYYLSGSNVLVYKSKTNTVFTLLKNVVDMNLLDNGVIAFARTDGTVWTNKIWESDTCTKVISPKVSKLTDINPKAWYFGAVNYAVNNNIISGLNETTFAPSNKLTRGMMVTILHRMEGNPAVSANAPTFKDVTDTKKYYYNAVRWAAANKIVSGYANGNFGPTDNITREQLAIILYKYAQYKGKDMNKTNDLSAFSDKSKVASWALPQVKWAVGNGVISGSTDKKTGNKIINPKGNATRAEVASMMEKYCKKVGR